MKSNKVKTFFLLLIFLWLGRICPDYREFRVVEEETYLSYILRAKK